MDKNSTIMLATQYEPPRIFEISEEELPGIEFTNGSTQSMTATMTNCDNK